MSLLGDQLLLNTIVIQASEVQQTMAAFQANAFWWDLHAVRSNAANVVFVVLPVNLAREWNAQPPAVRTWNVLATQVSEVAWA